MSGEIRGIADVGGQRFKPYPQYKDSGVEWLGKIPAHWEVRRLKRLFRVVNGSTPKSDEPAYWDGEIPWATPDDLGKLAGRELRNTGRYITREGYESCGTSIVPKGSLVLSTRAPIGHLAIAAVDLCTNQGCRSLVFRMGSDHEFFYFELAALRPILESLGDGSTFKELAKQSLEEVGIALPAAPEQRAIAAFLDWASAKIDALVAKKERLIGLLQEKRTTLITQAVTKGLPSTSSGQATTSVPMKDSGVEWLGEIPAHWDCVALSRVTTSRCDGPFGSGLKSEHYSESGVRVIRLQNIGWATFQDGDRVFLDEEYARQLGDHGVRPGDLLIAGLGDEGHPVGRACVAPSSLGPAMVKADCFRFRLKQDRLMPAFAAYQLTATADSAAGSGATGATRSRMNLTASARRKVAIPPPHEQLWILAFLEREAVGIEVLVAKIRDAIARLKEYRTALISAAVTGKIDAGKRWR